MKAIPSQGQLSEHVEKGPMPPQSLFGASNGYVVILPTFSQITEDRESLPGLQTIFPDLKLGIQTADKQGVSPHYECSDYKIKINPEENDPTQL